MDLKLADYKSDLTPDWCPGCGDYGILSALQTALYRLGIEPSRAVLVSGIGCSAKTVHYASTYGIHTLHGRGLPVAQGVKLANPELTVVAMAGDGDGMGIGAGHFVGVGRRNIDMLYLIFNNEVYGMTKGQASPTLELGAQPKSLARPNIQSKVNPLMLAFAAGFTFIARGYAYDVKNLARLIQAGIEHRGLAMIDILQPCPTYNNLHTREWFAPRVYDVNAEGYDPVVPAEMDDEERAGRMGRFTVKATEWGERIPTGVFWQAQLPTFEERLGGFLPGYPGVAPATRPAGGEAGRVRALLRGHRVAE
ncbi:thiamine pyrophosphate-dependent enzyme [Oceanithermus sp.]